MKWVRYMPTTCPWCEGSNEPRRYIFGRCNNSWHRSHPEHSLMWPTWVHVPDDEKEVTT